jgi:hypothetical protein
MQETNSILFFFVPNEGLFIYLCFTLTRIFFLCGSTTGNSHCINSHWHSLPVSVHRMFHLFHIVWIFHILFTHSSVGGHWAVFYLWEGERWLCLPCYSLSPTFCHCCFERSVYEKESPQTTLPSFLFFRTPYRSFHFCPNFLTKAKFSFKK